VKKRKDNVNRKYIGDVKKRGNNKKNNKYDKKNMNKSE
jgi:hypothetical protein